MGRINVSVGDVFTYEGAGRKWRIESIEGYTAQCQPLYLDGKKSSTDIFPYDIRNLKPPYKILTKEHPTLWDTIDVTRA